MDYSIYNVKNYYLHWKQEYQQDHTHDGQSSVRPLLESQAKDSKAHLFFPKKTLQGPSTKQWLYFDRSSSQYWAILMEPNVID